MLENSENKENNFSQLIKSPWYWAVPLFALVALAMLFYTESNKALFLTLNSALHIKNEFIWLNVTLFGDAAMAAVILLPLIWRRLDIVWAAIIAGIISAIIVNGGKEFFALLRPPGVLDAGTFHQIGNVFTSKSFPSGHTAAAFSVAAVVILSVRNLPIQIIALFCAVMVGLSRIAIGAHWPMDVLAGAIAGWLPSIIGVLLVRKAIFKAKYAVLFPALLLLSTVYYLVFVHQRGDAEARMLEITVPLFCLALAIAGFIRNIFNQKIK